MRRPDSVDVNGTRFHLIKNQADWLNCRERDDPSGPLAHVKWDPRFKGLTLNPVLTLFPRAQGGISLSPSDRRGAAADRFDNWYWIASDRRRIFWQPSGSGRPAVYWAQRPQPQPRIIGGFGPASAPPAEEAELAGLAVTEHHYLVVGNVSRRGLFLFDLHSGGEPLLLLFPQDVDFQPFDMAAAPGGGVWILDRENCMYWGLNRQFQVITDPCSLTSGSLPVSNFHPVGGPCVKSPSRQLPGGFALEVKNPMSIEALTDGSVLILDSPGPLPPLDLSPLPSTLYRYRLGKQVSPPLTLEADVEVGIAGTETMVTHLGVTGYDIAYAADDRTLYVVEHGGKQTIAFSLDFQASPVSLSVNREYLPMHYFGHRALVSCQGKVFYDVVGGDASNDHVVRWVQLHAVDRPRYDRDAVVLTPVLDGKERDCVWDRLFLDACIPAEAKVQVSTRALNDAQLLGSAPFIPEPNLYLRRAGAEIPYYDPFPDLDPLPDGTGTWELLFQQAAGRYLQIQLELSGNGGVTPQVRALRAYYPRYSYPRHYLPSLYLDDQESAWFLDRLLANLGSSYAEIEGKIRDVSVLFDPRSAPTETLDWLAGWIGLVLDPLWADIQARRSKSGQLPSEAVADRRRLFTRYALRLYNRRGTAEGIKFALHLLLDPCLEILLQRFKAAAVKLDPSLRDELAGLGLAYPTPDMTELDFEDLLHDYILAPDRPSKVRLVERFLARTGQTSVAGDVAQAGETPGDQHETQTWAHRFSVLVPEGLSAEEAAMVERIVNLEKPAHTMFDVRRYWDYFRVGEARLGLDTVLGEESRFVPMILGQNYLAEGYVYPTYPMCVGERVISDRDRTDTMPPL
jgi:phage tail-like protein